MAPHIWIKSSPFRFRVTPPGGGDPRTASVLETTIDDRAGLLNFQTGNGMISTLHETINFPRAFPNAEFQFQCGASFYRLTVPPSYDPWEQIWTNYVFGSPSFDGKYGIWAEVTATGFVLKNLPANSLYRWAAFI